jgi:hypothetical protein
MMSKNFLLAQFSLYFTTGVPKRVSHIPFRAFLVPVVFLVCCGLVASRLISDATNGIIFGPHWAKDEVPHSLAQDTPLLHSNMTIQCHDWCADRNDFSSHVATIDSCVTRCLSHPEVMGYLPGMRASAAVPHSGQGRTIVFAAWYAEGEQGSEVRSCPALFNADQRCTTHALIDCV